MRRAFGVLLISYTIEGSFKKFCWSWFIFENLLGFRLEDEPVAELFKFFISLRILGWFLLMLGSPNLKFYLLFSFKAFTLFGLTPSWTYGEIINYFVDPGEAILLKAWVLFSMTLRLCSEASLISFFSFLSLLC